MKFPYTAAYAENIFRGVECTVANSKLQMGEEVEIFDMFGFRC